MCPKGADTRDGLRLHRAPTKTRTCLALGAFEIDVHPRKTLTRRLLFPLRQPHEARIVDLGMSADDLPADELKKVPNSRQFLESLEKGAALTDLYRVLDRCRRLQAD